MSAEIRRLKDKDTGVIIYPQTLAEGVIFEDGDNAEEKLATKQNTIADLSTIRSGAAAGATAYQKPSAGIPKEHMTTSVQESLDLADSAVQATDIQTIEEIDPTLAQEALRKTAQTLTVDEKAIVWNNLGIDVIAEQAARISTALDDYYPNNDSLMNDYYPE